MDKHTQTISTRLDAMHSRRSKTLIALSCATAILAFFGLSIALAGKALPNTAATALTAQEQAQAHREGW
ncbi:hypothetical protein [Shimia sp.]|uniref:hypothetical protein n=1 Tax=Shimia sp. TaxID=1954381 RepID=UPI003BA87EE8